MDTDPVFCQECATWFVPDETWRCPCGNVAAFAVQPGTCTHCSQPAEMVRNGNIVRSLCRCTLDAPARLRLEERWREMDLEDQEVADQLAGVRKPRKPAPAGPPRLADDAPLRDWWPDLLELIPRHLATGSILDHIEGHREDFPLYRIVDCLRRVLERIQRKGTTVAAPSYITAALSRELGAA